MKKAVSWSCLLAQAASVVGSGSMAVGATSPLSRELDLIGKSPTAANPQSLENLQSTKKAKRPNIILILADDMGYSDIGCYGGEIDTPNLNKLAQNGIRFTQFYNTARCCPSRASLLTGLHPHQAGMGGMTGGDTGLDGYRGDLNSNCVTIAEVLRQAGYGTYMTGKWHLSRNTKAKGPKTSWPCQRGFDRYYGFLGGASSYFDPVSLARDNEIIETPKEDYYTTDAFSDNASQFIKDHQAKSPDKPFFVYVAYNASHWPLHAREKDIAKYKGKFDAGCDKLREARLQRMVKMGIIDKNWALSPRDPQKTDWESVKNKAWETRRMETYAAMIDSMDQGIGRIVKTLKDAKQLDNTMIVFLADNGGCHEGLGPGTDSAHYWLDILGVGKQTTKDGRPIRFGNDPSIMPGPDDTYSSYGRSWANLSNTPFRRFKCWIQEGGISTPLIMQWPNGIKSRNALRNQTGQLPDIMATILEVSGAAYPSEYAGNKITPLEGVSLAPAFDNKPIVHEALYWEHIGNRGIRVGDWKMVAEKDKPWELYEMKADRTELHDLAAQMPERIKEMEAKWTAWANRAHVLPNKVEKKPAKATK
ncbi:MAG: arylsulfatase [Armatimonadetes bacterium]|nr:arylsulfatase [Armatimonadota bacterium]